MKKSVSRLGAVVATAAALALTLSACGGQQNRPAVTESGEAGACEAPAQQLSIATGNATGVYYVLGGGIAEVLSSETDLRVTAAETGASVQNIEQLVAGDYSIAFSLADVARDAVAGTGSFTEPQPIMTLGRTHQNSTQVIVRADSGITSLEDMAGKTVSSGSPGSGTEVIALRLLEAVGLDPEADVSLQRLDLATSISGLQNGTVDALFWSGGLPTPNITELFTTSGDDVEFIDITPALPALQEINEVYAEGSIPADTYGLPADVPTIVVPNYLLVRDDFDDATACAITSTIWGNVDAIAAVHPAGNSLDPAYAIDTDPVPLAPGSRTALEELGG